MTPWHTICYSVGPLLLDVAHKSAERLAGIVAKTEVDELITACQQCKPMVMSVFKDRGIKIKVRDVVELVNDIKG